MKLHPAFVIGLVAVLVGSACDGFSSAEDPKQDGGSSDAFSTDATGVDATITDVAVEDGGPSGPIVIATSNDPIPWVTYDAQRVIWSTGVVQSGGDGTISACPKTGCTGAPTALDTNVPVGTLGTTGQTAYVGFSKFDRGIERIEQGGALTNLGTPANKGFNFFLDTSSLFFMTYGAMPIDGGVMQIRTVSRFALPSGPATEVGRYESEANIGNFAVTADRVFLGAHNMGRIVTCARTNCVFGIFGESDDYYGLSLTTDGSRLYWVAGNLGLMSCAAGAKCGGVTREIQSVMGNRVLAVEHHDGFLYFQRSNGDLVECQAAACSTSARVIARETEFHVQTVSARNLAVDDAAVYYVAKDGSQDAGNVSYRVMRALRSKK